MSESKELEGGRPELEISMSLDGIKFAFFNQDVAQSFVSNIDKVNWNEVISSLGMLPKQVPPKEVAPTSDVEVANPIQIKKPPPSPPPPPASKSLTLPSDAPEWLNQFGHHLTSIVQGVEDKVLKSQEAILTRIKEQVILEDRLFSKACDEFSQTTHFKGLDKTRHGVYAFLRTSFIDIVGDKLLSEIRYKDLLHYADMLKHIPPHAKQKPQFKGMDYEAIAREAKKKNLKPLQTSTQFKFVKALKKLFHDFMVRYEMGKDLTTCIIGSDYAREEGQSRQPFTDEELRQIFDPAFMKDLDAPWKFWAIMLAFFSGMRVNEIGQIDVDDLCWVPSGVDSLGNTVTIPCISLNRKDGKRLKSRNAKRYLPLHSTLIAMGFLDFHAHVDSLGFKHLFPDLREGGGRPGAKISTWFNTTHLKSWCEIDDTQKKFHSFRNHFWTYGELTTTVPESALRKLTGIGRGRSTERVHYIKEAEVPGCKKALEDIVFPKVDFMPYNPAQFTQYFNDQVQYAQAGSMKPIKRKRGRPPKIKTPPAPMLSRRGNAQLMTPFEDEEEPR